MAFTSQPLTSLITNFRCFRVFASFPFPFRNLSSECYGYCQVTNCRFVLQNFAVLYIPFGYAPYKRDSVSLQIFLITSSRCFRILGFPILSLSGFLSEGRGCYLSTSWYNLVTVVTWYFGLVHYLHCCFRYYYRVPLYPPVVSLFRENF